MSGYFWPPAYPQQSLPMIRPSVALPVYPKPLNQSGWDHGWKDVLLDPQQSPPYYHTPAAQVASIRVPPSSGWDHNVPPYQPLHLAWLPNATFPRAPTSLVRPSWGWDLQPPPPEPAQYYPSFAIFAPAAPVIAMALALFSRRRRKRWK